MTADLLQMIEDTPVKAMPTVTISLKRWHRKRGSDVLSGRHFTTWLYKKRNDTGCCLSFSGRQLSGLTKSAMEKEVYPTDCAVMSDESAKLYLSDLFIARGNERAVVDGKVQTVLSQINDRRGEWARATDLEQRMGIELAFMALLGAQVRWAL